MILRASLFAAIFLVMAFMMISYLIRKFPRRTVEIPIALKTPGTLGMPTMQQSFGPEQRASASQRHSRQHGDGAFGANDEGSAFGEGAYGVELHGLLLSAVDAAGVVWGTEVEDEIVADDE